AVAWRCEEHVTTCACATVPHVDRLRVVQLATAPRERLEAGSSDGRGLLEDLGLERRACLRRKGRELLERDRDVTFRDLALEERLPESGVLLGRRPSVLPGAPHRACRHAECCGDLRDARAMRGLDRS